jgi:glutathione S-transferase
MGGYDLYQAFGGFAADDGVAKKKFEEKKAPQFFGALGEIYVKTPFAAGETPCSADCLAHQAVVWCVRRNDVARALFEARASLVTFQKRFEQVPAIQAFMARQSAARATDKSL